MKKTISVICYLFLLACLPALGQSKSKYTDSLLLVLKTVKTDTGKVSVLSDLAYEYITDDPAETRRYGYEALALSKKNNYIRGQITSHNVIGLSFYHAAQYDSAMAHYQICSELAEKSNDKVRMSIAMNNIGLVYDDKADYTNALKYYFKSLALMESQNQTRQTAGTINNIALIYQNMGKYDDALKYHLQALKIKREVGYMKGVGSSLHNLGLVYKLQGQYDKSLEYYQQALELRESINDESGTAMTLNNIGSVYESKGEFEKAREYIERAMKIREHLNDKYNLAITMLSLGSNYCNRKDYKAGFDYINEAMEISRSIGAKELLRHGYQNLADFSALQGNYQAAYNFQQELIKVKDSILNSETTQQLNELQTKYETEKKQKEIELLTKDYQIQELQINKGKLWMIALCSVVLIVLLIALMLYNRYKHKKQANDILEHRNTEITLQKKEITDSINYAKRIQESILPPEEHWQKLLPQSFIFYRPKDIVSGDFYWIEQKDRSVCFAAVDCTGHGVPGALMSVVGFNLLTQAVNEVGLTRPSEILKHLDAGVTRTLRQSAGKGVKDGMDLSLCTLHLDSNELEYAGAFNSLYYVSNNVLHEIKADKFPIGVNLDGYVDEYTNHRVQLQKGDCIYLFSDGYADQFGGPRGKKFKYNQLKDLLTSISQLPLDVQRSHIEKTFDSWKGQLEQIDDVVIIGVRV
jgi:serine phosphatase RsbU (regulator of sigma subunit)/Tfp pilus assembly protein PilF